MRAIKIVGLVAGGLVATIALAMLAIWLFVDPNDYKDRIAAAVRSSTGRELSLPGDIKLAVFPWLALEVGPATLGNPAGFGDEPFAAVQRASLRVRLVPLLRSELQIGRIEIDGLDLRLKQNAEGQGNWVFGEDEPASPAASGSSRTLDLEGVKIRNSRVSFDALVAQSVDIDVGSIAPGTTIPLKAQLELVTEPGAQPLPLSASFELTTDAQGEQFRLTQLDVAGTLPPQPGTVAMPWQFTAPDVSVDLARQTLTAATFAARFASAQIGGSVDGEKIVDSPAFSGAFDMKPVALRELLKQLGIEPPVTRDANALASLSLSGTYRYAGDDAQVGNLKAKLDDSSLAGELAMNLESTAMKFDLQLDRIDLDRYLPPPTTAPSAAKTSAPFELPVEALKPLTASGQLTIGETTLADVRLSNVRVGVAAKDGVTRIAPARAQLYGGQYAGEITVDTRPATPMLTIDQTMTGIDVAQLLNDFLETRRLSGKGNVSTSLTGYGRNSDALIRTLKGKVSANLVDGAVEGLDIWYAISQAQSLIQKRTLAEGTNTKRTAFDTFKVSADVNGGIATTSDLAIASQLLRISGKGTSNLSTLAIDYQVLATVLKAPPQADEALAALTLASIPVKITGTFDDPKVRADLEGLAKARLKQEVEKRKDEIEEKVKDKLQDKLKGLFNR